MENRKEELYSQAIPAGKRRYFFDVKETRGGDKFITITESRRIFDNNTGEFYYDKNKIFLYKEDFEKFQKGLANAFSFISSGIPQMCSAMLPTMAPKVSASAPRLTAFRMASSKPLLSLMTHSATGTVP